MCFANQITEGLLYVLMSLEYDTVAMLKTWLYLCLYYVPSVYEVFGKDC